MGARRVTEVELQREVERICDQLGLLWFHDRDSRRNKPGFPDLVVCGRGGLLFIELKSETGHIKPAQLEWAVRLQAAGAAYRLWRPESLTDGTIQRELRALQGEP